MLPITAAVTNAQGRRLNQSASFFHISYTAAKGVTGQTSFDGKTRMRQRDDWHLTGDIEHERGSGDPFAAAVRATRMPMVVTNPELEDNPIVFCNEAFQRLCGYERNEIIGRNCRFLQGPETDKGSVLRIRAAIESGRDVELDILNYRKDGSTFWNALYLSPVRNASGDIKFFFASQLDVTARIEAQLLIARQKEEIEREVQARTAALRTALDTKTLLLHEVDHRVKNNLTLIGSLLRLQVRRITDPVISSQLNTMLERLDALSAVHRQLYESSDLAVFDVGALAESLAMEIVGASGREDIAIARDVSSVRVSSSLAAPLGLILNEVITNAVKHGFANGRSGTLKVHAKSDGSSGMIAITDDGAGFGTEPPSGGLGSVLIERLIRQIGGRASFESAQPGSRVTLVFPVHRE